MSASYQSQARLSCGCRPLGLEALFEGVEKCGKDKIACLRQAKWLVDCQNSHHVHVGLAAEYFNFEYLSGPAANPLPPWAFCVPEEHRLETPSHCVLVPSECVYPDRGGARRPTLAIQ